MGQVGVCSDPSGAEECMRPALSARIGLFAFVLLAVTFLPKATAAQTVELSGRYQCAAAKVHGKSVPCTATPLTLKTDGKFELQGWEGSYMVNGQWVELSDSVVRSRAKIEPGHKIVFRYHGKHGWCEMVFERRFTEAGKASLS
jgi:hypothetical protein